jgi:pyrimidine-nucleoside phosphorylase
MRAVVDAQGGNASVLDDPAVLPHAPVRRSLEVDRSGFIGTMDVRAIGESAVALGAGRARLEDEIDPGVGFHVTAKPGEAVRAGERIATVFARNEAAAARAIAQLRAAMPVVEEAIEALPLVSRRITSAEACAPESR